VLRPRAWHTHSGHSTYAGATCVALVLLFTTPGTRRRWWWALASLGAVGMAWSRTYLQVHWLTNVTAGALLGSGVSLLAFAIAQRHERTGTRSTLHDAIHSQREPDLPMGPAEATLDVTRVKSVKIRFAGRENQDLQAERPQSCDFAHRDRVDA
jgi:hypothetical protein